MGKKDFITLKGTEKFLSGEKIFSETEKEIFLEEVNELLQEQPKGELPLKLKVQFFCALRYSEKYPLLIDRFENLSIDDQFKFFLPKKELDEGCFGLIESYWDESPEDKSTKLIFIAQGGVGELLGVELNTPSLSIVEGLKKNGEVKISPVTGGTLHHRLIAVI